MFIPNFSDDDIRDVREQTFTVTPGQLQYQSRKALDRRIKAESGPCIVRRATAEERLRHGIGKRGMK